MKYLKHILTLLLILNSIHLICQENKYQSFSFITFGDMPYYLPQDYTRFETVIKEVNALNPSFIINVGDFKSSSTPCSNEAYFKILNYYTQFNKPLIYTPGDNEWTDCYKKEAGEYDPEERLAQIRKMFFNDSVSLGKETLKLNTQSKTKGFEKFIENKYWDYGKITFATIHIVGTNNNFLATSTDGNKEFFEREKANMYWLEEVFKKAIEKKQAGIVIAIHADMFYRSYNIKDGSGFYTFKKRLQKLVSDFKKPVLLINGDSHEFLIDKPFIENEKTLNNFTRVQVPGEKNMNLIKININPNNPNLFSFEELNFNFELKEQ